MHTKNNSMHSIRKLRFFFNEVGPPETSPTLTTHTRLLLAMPLYAIFGFVFSQWDVGEQGRSLEMATATGDKVATPTRYLHVWCSNSNAEKDDAFTPRKCSLRLSSNLRSFELIPREGGVKSRKRA
jgi:hypothetical protein